MPGVFLNEDDYNFDIALRRFKKQVEKAGILSEMKKRQHFEKPSVMRKKKKAAARKRLLRFFVLPDAETERQGVWNAPSF